MPPLATPMGPELHVSNENFAHSFFYVISGIYVYFTKSGISNTTRTWNLTKKSAGHKSKCFCKQHKILIYSNKNQCKWKLLNFLGVSDSFNELLVDILVGLDTTIMFLLQVVTKLWPNFIICKFRPRVKFWESRWTPKHQPLVKKI